MEPLCILCIGGAAVDHIYEAEGPLALHCSNPVSGRSGFGGVARNAAEVLARLGAKVSLASVIGDDSAGRELASHARAQGIDVSLLRRLEGARTASYVATFHRGELFAAFADMDIFDALDGAFVSQSIGTLGIVEGVLADCNLLGAGIEAIRDQCGAKRLPLALETVSPVKAMRLGDDLKGVSILFTNRAEAEAMTRAKQPEKAVELLAERGAAKVVASDGPRGCHCADEHGSFRLAMPQSHVRNVNGAGDALAAGAFLGVLEGACLKDAVIFGMGCAHAALETPNAETQGLDRREAERRSRMIAQIEPC
jgi:pseudouridine kinase